MTTKDNEIPVVELQEIRKAIIKKRDHLEYNDILVSLFGPFSSKYHVLDHKAIEKACQTSDLPSDKVAKQFIAESIIDRYDPDSIAGSESEFLTWVKDELQSNGVNAFVASEIPPFGPKNDNQQNWSGHLEEDILKKKWNYVRQSFYYSLISNINVFIFRYWGNPVGVTFEFADVLRGRPSYIEDDAKSLVFFELKPQDETEVCGNYEDDDRKRVEYYCSNDGMPGYLSAMIVHALNEYERLRWEDFKKKRYVIKRIWEHVRIANKSGNYSSYIESLYQ